ncbi:hypothetical protein VTN00DRAFT_9040 [Thermoascus crustaceus]|uniref:uncharacterized protein n=1 Tax=Thermoascus crustaceus TaxID=5088 RepID=UPI0037448262
MDDFTVEAFTLLGVAAFLAALRSYARWTLVGPAGFQLDDYLMPFAIVSRGVLQTNETAAEAGGRIQVVYGLETAAAYIVGARFEGLANNAMTPEQRASLDPNSREYGLRVGGAKTQIVGWSLYTLLLWLLKTCMAVSYSRLTDGLRHMQTRIRIAYAMIAVTYIATISSILLGCQPMRKNWQINPDPGNLCQPAVSKINIYVTVVLNVMTDSYLMAIPAPMFWKARIRLRRKIALTILFSGGIFVMTAGILRCVLILRAGPNGAQQAGSWACRESFVAVAINNIPMIYPLARRLLRQTGLYPFNPSYGSQEYPLSAEELRDMRKRSQKYPHPLSLPTETKWESEEQVILRPSGEESKEGIMVTHETTVQRMNKEENTEELGYQVSTRSAGNPGYFAV